MKNQTLRPPPNDRSPDLISSSFFPQLETVIIYKSSFCTRSTSLPNFRSVFRRLNDLRTEGTVRINIVTRYVENLKIRARKPSVERRSFRRLCAVSSQLPHICQFPSFSVHVFLSQFCACLSCASVLDCGCVDWTISPFGSRNQRLHSQRA